MAAFEVFLSLKLKDILKEMVNDYWLQIFIQMQKRIALGFLFPLISFWFDLSTSF